MTTTIRLMGELAAMRVVGVASVNHFVYAVQGDRAREVIDWLEGQRLRLNVWANWDQGQLRGVYVMVQRSAESEQYIRELNDALTVFALAFRGAEGFDWQAEPVKAGKAFMRRALAS